LISMSMIDEDAQKWVKRRLVDGTRTSQDRRTR